MLAKSQVSLVPPPVSDDNVSDVLPSHGQGVQTPRRGPYRDEPAERRAEDLARELALAHLHEAQALRSALERAGAGRVWGGLVVGVMGGAALTSTVAVAWLAPLDVVDRSNHRAVVNLVGADVEQRRALTELEERLRALEQREVTQRGESAPPSPPLPAEPDGLEVVPLAEGEYLVARSFLLDGVGAHSTARLVPHEVDGITLGVRVLGIRQDSRPWRLGVQNGDTLVSVNGISLASPESALQAYVAISGSTSAELVILRRGRRVTLRYTILG